MTPGDGAPSPAPPDALDGIAGEHAPGHTPPLGTALPAASDASGDNLAAVRIKIEPSTTTQSTPPSPAVSPVKAEPTVASHMDMEQVAPVSHGPSPDSTIQASTSAPISSWTLDKSIQSSLHASLSASLSALKRARESREPSTANDSADDNEQSARKRPRTDTATPPPQQPSPRAETQPPAIQAAPAAPPSSSSTGLDISAMLKSALSSYSAMAVQQSNHSTAHSLSPLPQPPTLAATAAAPTRARMASAGPSLSPPSSAHPAATPTPPPPDVTAAAAAPARAKSATPAHESSGSGSLFPKRMRFLKSPTYIVRSMGLPLLGSLAVQVLYAQSEKETIDSIRSGESTGGSDSSNKDDASSEAARVYTALLAAFRSIRRLFSETASILLPEELDIKELGDQETIQMANMATICASAMAADDVSLIDMHDHFLMTFLPESGALTSDLGALFLSLKRRAVAQQLQLLPDDEQRGRFIERLFPSDADLEDQLKQLHPDVPTLSEAETKFCRDMGAAKGRLLDTLQPEEKRRALVDTYPMQGFRDALNNYLRTNVDVILRYAETHGIEIPAAEEDVPVEELLPVNTTIGKATAATTPSGDAERSGNKGDGDTGKSCSTEVAGTPATPKPSVEGLNRVIQDALQSSTAAAQSTQLSKAFQAVAAAQAESSARKEAAPATGSSDVTGLSMLIKQRLSEKAQAAQAAQALRATQAAPTQAHIPLAPGQPQSPVAAANAALNSMQNTYAAQLALYRSRTPSFASTPTQQQPSPPKSNGEAGSHGAMTGDGTGGASGGALSRTDHPPGMANFSMGGAPVPALPPNQSSPSSVLYQRARQAAVVKMTAYTRREGLHSTRRPWSPEEEQALMTGLDMVQGPHWSQILQLFGTNGTISDILKDRSQVQLKDKARNLKLFFLKANSEMPYYLKCVTGELKTRAPGQAARKEAAERTRSTTEEEQARVQGIMTLAGGLQNKAPAPQASALATPKAQQPLAPKTAMPLPNIVAGGAAGMPAAGAATANGRPGGQDRPLQAHHASHPQLQHLQQLQQRQSSPQQPKLQQLQPQPPASQLLQKNRQQQQQHPQQQQHQAFRYGSPSGNSVAESALAELRAKMVALAAVRQTLGAASGKTSVSGGAATESPPAAQPGSSFVQPPHQHQQQDTTAGLPQHAPATGPPSNSGPTAPATHTGQAKADDPLWRLQHLQAETRGVGGGGGGAESTNGAAISSLELTGESAAQQSQQRSAEGSSHAVNGHGHPVSSAGTPAGSTPTVRTASPPRSATPGSGVPGTAETAAATTAAAAVVEPEETPEEAVMRRLQVALPAALG